MKKLNRNSLFLFALALCLGFSGNALAQGNSIRASQKASVTQFIGNDAQITFTFSRPGVKGRTVWGDIVPYGLTPGNKYSDNKPFPWRAGANENTTMEINKDVKVEGQPLPAGKYSIHMIPSEKDWVVIFNKKSDQWGSYKYDEAEDALRVTVTPAKAPHEEWLTFGFDDITDNSVVAYLHWEKLMVPFKVELE
ncbi:MAG: DUF2911 domain-containing protein [Phaeodactylibacter sp.]|nr:DUF2911 domain-containing protein [Phaeodactylibacter sp.]MCB9273300.1 DUF2911 domain-containing protein [Lewinellaceae bacterium]